jgi:hypothetical protein
MRCAIFGSVALAFFSIMVPTAAKDLPAGGLTAQDVVNLLQAKGYRAELKQDDNGKPNVASATQGVNFFVHFFDCTNDRCASIQFVAGFSTKGSYTLEQANNWNFNNRWITAAMDKEKDPWVSQDVDLSPGGTYENLNDEIQVWDDSLGRFLKTINK